VQTLLKSITNRSDKSSVKIDETYDAHIQETLKASGQLPEHVAIIMDGNGRWAKERGKIRVLGHKAGVKTVRDIVEASRQLGIKYLTLYTFSKENWKRPKQEISALMNLLISALHDETEELHENNIRINLIGKSDDLPPKVQESLHHAMELTKNNTQMTLSLALSYSGRWEIMEAAKQIAQAAKEGKLDPNEINESMFESFLSTANIPNPELLIRTSGEFRLSNFLLWQLAYTEIHISDCYWPDFNRMKLYEALRDFQRRERRYGLTSEQVTELKPALKQFPVRGRTTLISSDKLGS